jgi:hypothetical protein
MAGFKHDIVDSLNLVGVFSHGIIKVEAKIALASIYNALEKVELPQA